MILCTVRRVLYVSLNIPGNMDTFNKSFQAHYSKFGPNVLYEYLFWRMALPHHAYSSIWKKSTRRALPTLSFLPSFYLSPYLCTPFQKNRNPSKPTGIQNHLKKPPQAITHSPPPSTYMKLCFPKQNTAQLLQYCTMQNLNFPIFFFFVMHLLPKTPSSLSDIAHFWFCIFHLQPPTSSSLLHLLV